jgi:hypothetical protein
LSPAPSKPPGMRKFKAAKCLTSIQSHKDLPVDPPVIHDTCQNAPDLAAVMAAWPELPEAVRAGIVAMVRASLRVPEDSAPSDHSPRPRKGGGS